MKFMITKAKLKKMSHCEIYQKPLTVSAIKSFFNKIQNHGNDNSWFGSCLPARVHPVKIRKNIKETNLLRRSARLYIRPDLIYYIH